jgi:hypothetical protein
MQGEFGLISSVKEGDEEKQLPVTLNKVPVASESFWFKLVANCNAGSWHTATCCAQPLTSQPFYPAEGCDPCLEQKECVARSSFCPHLTRMSRNLEYCREHGNGGARGRRY